VISFEVSQAIATVTMNRPPVNGMSDGWVTNFHDVLDALQSRSDWNIVVIQSALPVFCAGADLKQFSQRFDLPIDEQLAAGIGYQRLLARIEKIPRVTIAAIAGPALGGGFELALSCDLRIASSKARLGLPEVSLGLLPAAGGTQRLTRLCGRATAARLILGAELIGTEEALRLGIVQWVFEPDAFDKEAQLIAERLARLPGHAVAAAKTAISAAAEPGDRGYDVETEGVRTLLQSEQTRSLVTAFLNRSTVSASNRSQDNG
jgi:enoyl-CoA hydratase/carnithine racemase